MHNLFTLEKSRDLCGVNHPFAELYAIQTQYSTKEIKEICPKCVVWLSYEKVKQQNEIFQNLRFALEDKQRHNKNMADLQRTVLEKLAHESAITKPLTN